MPHSPTSTPDACPQAALQAAWSVLANITRDVGTLDALFTRDPGRTGRYQCQAGPLQLDYSRQNIDDQVLAGLLALAEAAGCQAALQDLVQGAIVNNTERRTATHTRLREPAPVIPPHWQFADRVRQGDFLTARGDTITDVVNIGIGGSHLGPELAVSALGGGDGPRLHFLSNIDPAGLQRIMSQVPVRTTLFIVSSKSLSTQETRLNAQAICDWMDQKAQPGWRARQLAVISNNTVAAESLGVSPELLFRIDESVGGRYSVWSAIDLPMAIAVGSIAMQAFHRGAHAIDRHALETPASHNLPLLMALLGIWNRNFLQRPTQAVVAYDNCLTLLPAYLQQLVMESNGKCVQRDGTPVACHTAPVIWGGIGSNGQHSFHQCLHQGTDIIPVDFLIPATGAEPQAHHDALVANALAQAHTLAFGSASPLAPQDPADALAAHRHMPGNRPSSLLCYSRLDAETLGALIACWEHKTFFESVIWGINPFDQWGVELGKHISQAVLPALQSGCNNLPADLQATMNQLLRLRTSS